jgi:Domain of unknown function (DUF1707)
MATPADRQRERAVGILKRAYAEGRIAHDDFDRRVQRALSTRSAWELPILLRGLLVDDARARGRIKARVAAIKAGWTMATLFALYATAELARSGLSLWLLAFPLVWVGISVVAYRALRRARRAAAYYKP